ncbi:PGAP2-interacting protein [Hypsibius exemplaris]|uniref:PGAP2-interacting protein n=1 Tax=Hypsibius exemplaris TaxID=2072580 RepID=A0A1W0WBD2_HYPEX|nr:PGAP2-interacting protein [Hypsibius exemplaris]
MGPIEICHDVVAYYCFWSLFYGLAPMIWFYPLNDLDITGYEVFAVVWLIPVITAVGPLRRVMQTRWGLFVLEAVMLTGILSFNAPTTWSRLAVLSLGNAAAVLYLSARLFSQTVRERLQNFWMLLTANLLFLASRILTRSIAPMWMNRETNLAIAAVFGVSVVMMVVRPFSSPTTENSATASSTTASSTTKHKDKAKDFKKSTTACRGDPSPGIPSPGMLGQAASGVTLGSILYLSHWVFGELGVLSRWSVKGYPTTGPTPFLSAPFVLFALIAGTFFAAHFSRLSASPLTWIIGTVAFFATYFLDAWPGFVCGLLLAVYSSVLWVNMMERVVVGHPAVVITLSMLTYLAEIFFHVWTVAYNFVPGGVYTREHSDFLIGFMCLTFLFTVPKKSGSCLSKHTWPAAVPILLALTFVVALLGTCIRLPAQPTAKKQLNPTTRDFSALIWTFHFGYDNQGWPSLKRAADLLNKTNADVIALLESDASKPYLGHNDLGMWLSEELGMFVDFGPATKDHTWGNLLLSKYPIIASTHHLLPSPHGELAPAISATLNVSGNLVDIISTHMGNDRDAIDRDVQTKYLSTLSAASANPVIFLGYVTSVPGSRDYQHFTSKGGLTDIDPTDKSRFCEYILYKNLIREGYARISHGGLSDTELQLARFSIPVNLNSYRDNDVVGVDAAQVDRWKRFPDDFGSHTAGHYYPWTHHYHMSTPKYFTSGESVSM